MKPSPNRTPTAKRSKYGNTRTEIDGITFASKREARRYAELRLLERIGDISDLELQPRFPLVVNGHLVATYIADFRYVRRNDGHTVIEDVKTCGTVTPVFQLKRKLLRATQGIEIALV